LALGGEQPSGQRCTGAKEDAYETQEVAEQFGDASQGVPEVPEEVDAGVHAPLITEGASDGNMP
jgi:hypothetical protein